MLKLIHCEFLKLKGSRIMFLNFIGVCATPCLMLIEALQIHFDDPTLLFSLSDIYSNSLLYVMLLMNIMIYITISSYLFSFEYTQNTLKNILSIPVSRRKFIFSKFVVLLIWSFALMLLTWGGILVLIGVYNIFIGIQDYSLSVAFSYLRKFLLGNLLMYLTISPFAFIAQKSKGIVMPMIIATVTTMASAALCNQELGALYPFTIAYFSVSGRLTNSPYSIFLSIGIIALFSLIGFYLTFRYFVKEDL